jgi:SRR1
MRYRKKPSICYVAMQHLISETWIDFLEVDLAYCNLKIYHDVDMLIEETNGAVRRTKFTGKPKDQLKQIFEKDLHEWMSSEQCRQLKSMKILREDTHRVKKIIAFACGSITHADPRSRARSSYQHGLIITMREILSQARQDEVKRGQEDAGERIQCFVQDPWYTDVETEIFFEDYGISTLEDPVGFLEVDDSTLVLSFSPNVPCKQIIADIAKPAIIIWDRVREEAENRRWDM